MRKQGKVEEAYEAIRPIYHASTVAVAHPDVEHSRPHLDFGRGFYLTALREQAESYAQRFIRRGKPAFNSEYELDEDLTGYSVKRFEAYDEPWLDYVTQCRHGDTPVQQYDAVEGGVELEDALAFFYDSDTYALMSEGVADMHCRSDEYLADELMLELQQRRPQGLTP